jgi:hypothetical protein
MNQLVAIAPSPTAFQDPQPAPVPGEGAQPVVVAPQPVVVGPQPVVLGPGGQVVSINGHEPLPFRVVVKCGPHDAILTGEILTRELKASSPFGVVSVPWDKVALLNFGPPVEGAPVQGVPVTLVPAPVNVAPPPPPDAYPARR